MLERKFSGFALVSTLWLLIMMSVMVSALAWSNRHTIKSAAAIKGHVQALHLAEGALQLTYGNLLERNSRDRLLADGDVLTLDMPGGSVAVMVTDENGKIDINEAGSPLISRLLLALGVDDSFANSLADAIVDYRDKDGLRRLNGAEDPDYEAAGLAWEAKDALFTSIDELRKVLGMSEELFELMRPHVTVYTGSRGINPEVAALPVLLSVSGASEYYLRSYIEQRRSNHDAGLPLPEPPMVNRRFATPIRALTYSLNVLGEDLHGYKAGLSTSIRVSRGRTRAVIQTLDRKSYVHSSVLRIFEQSDTPRITDSG